MDIDEVLRQLEAPVGVFPRTALEAAVSNREAITPYLLRIIEEDATKLADRERYFGHLFAMYLLAQFREERSYSLIVDLFSGQADDVDDMAGDFLTEGLKRVLASVSGGDPGPIKRLVENREANEWARGAAVRALVVMVATGQLPREEIVAYFKELFEGGLEREFSHVWNLLVSASVDIYPEELLDEIARAYDDELVEEFFVARDDVEDRMKTGSKERALEEVAWRQNTLIDDAIAELERWAVFRRSEPAAARPKQNRSRGSAKAKIKRKAAKAARKKNRR